MPQFAPYTPDGLVRLIGERCLEHDGLLRVAVDGPAAGDPRALAERVAVWLQETGRPSALVDLDDFQLPASQRFENGRDDPDSFASAWFDYGALGREVLDPLGASCGIPPSWLPRLRNAGTDRSVRVLRRQAPAGLVMLVAGPMLLGRWLDFDLTVHLRMDEPALRQRTPVQSQFTLAAVLAYQEQLEVEPDLLVRYNHPHRPAVQLVP
ncbi:hypothetical protein IV498_03280 [Paenarthrobacter sp. Z7-10]|uniref:uridine kinase n=1 Tax=Paenarthrobacter sp. Z7-10 TaxID=2787635 RepID=UPI0022A99AEA|nr:uridine kinase [Paenarthrobacter sp. Z7-10]MCZ2402226.1 hypothetical protein [Paenarthrobacter sp. Z7-10]